MTIGEPNRGDISLGTRSRSPVCLLGNQIGADRRLEPDLVPQPQRGAVRGCAYSARGLRIGRCATPSSTNSGPLISKP